MAPAGSGDATRSSAAGYVARVLSSEDPAEIPIAQDAVFDFVISLRTA